MLPDYVPPTYPVLQFIARKGMTTSVCLALVLGACGLGLAWLTQTWLVIPIVIAAVVFLLGLLASYVELVRVIVDTMVPR